MQELQELVQWLVYILTGIPATLLLAFIGLAFGFAYGILIAIWRVYGPPVIQMLGAAYERIMRSIPVLVLIMIFGVGLPGLFAFAGPGTNSLIMAAGFSLALRSSAYQSGIFRSAIMAVPLGQMQAAKALGMSALEANLYIVLPQAFRLAIPAWSNEYAVVIKDTSYALVIGVSVMDKLALNIYATAPQAFFSVVLILTLIYFCFTYPVTKLAGEHMTKKLKKLGLGGG
ncbi:MAG: amino acid ABC transporter permease [Candidatus Thorarchaeota archaeon]|nr:amino acid ABC transporter permease [Candidatus Thorarchaeota archaeon]